MPDARKKELLARSINVHDAEVTGLYTKPRTWGVYCIIGPTQANRQFRLGNYPVREIELRNDFKERDNFTITRVALYKDRSLAEELKKILTQENRYLQETHTVNPCKGPEGSSVQYQPPQGCQTRCAVVDTVRYSGDPEIPDGRPLLTKTQKIHALAQKVADELPDMFRKKGPGEGNHFTNQYMARLNAAVRDTIGRSYVEQKICEPTDQCVDFYVPEEATIIEIELSLYNVHTNLDRDIFKALIAKDAGHSVASLLLIGKEPAKERHNQPASRALIDLVKKHHGLTVVIEDIKKKA